MTYFLDTNACIALIKGLPRGVRRRFERAVGAGHAAAVSTVTVFELWYGAMKSGHRDANLRRIEAFLAGPLELRPFESEDARLAGGVRATLEAFGKPIGAYDLLIAGQALRHEMTLVTANAREFSRVPGLKWQDWAK